MDLKVAQSAFLDELHKVAEALTPEEIDLEAAWKKHRLGLTGGQKLREGLSTIGGGVSGAGLGAGAGYLGSHLANRLLHTNFDPQLAAIMGGAAGGGLGMGVGSLVGDVHGQSDVNAGKSLEKYIKKEDKLYGPGYDAQKKPAGAASSLVAGKKTASPLTEQAREHISKKNFAVSAKASNTGKPAYPIPDKAHAASALGFAKMHGDPKDIAEVKKDVASKFPGMEKKDKESCGIKVSGINPLIFKAAGAALKSFLHGAGEEALPVAGAVLGSGLGKMMGGNQLATSAMGYGGGGLLDLAIRKHMAQKAA